MSPEDLLVTMREGKPSQRYKQDMEKKKKEEKSVTVLKEMEQAEDMIYEAKDMHRAPEQEDDRADQTENPRLIIEW